MAYCSKCQYPMADNAKFCPNCGAPVEITPPAPRLCPVCFTEIPEGSRFCTSCGTPVGAVPAPQSASQSVAPPPAEPVTSADEDLFTAAAAPAKKKGKGGLIAAIIAIVLVLALGVSWALGAFDGLFEEDDRRAGSSHRDKDDEEEEEEEDEEEEDEDDEKDREDEDAGNSTEEIPAASESEPETEPAQPSAQQVELTVWVPIYDEYWLYAMVDEFNASHPEYQLSVSVEFCNEGDAGSLVSADPQGAADIYMYSNDQLGILVQCGGLARLDGACLAQVERDNSYSMISSVTYTDGSVYGFPYTSNTWFMYYDKSVYSEEDIRSLETMLEKGAVTFPLNNGWYLGAFYAAGGATFFGPDGTDVSAGIRLENGEMITDYLVDLLNHPNFRIYDDQAIMAYLAGGEVNAFFSGYWMLDTVSEVLGDNMGIAQLPTINVNGETLQLQAFAGSKAIGVNPWCDNPDVAMLFAAFLASPEAQLARYEANHTVPACPALVSEPAIADDPVALAQLLVVQNTSVPQPTIPEMSYYWGPAEILGNAIISGEVTHSNAGEITAEIEAAMNP